MKIDKICIYLLWSLFELENASVFHAGRTESIAKVLKDVHEKLQPFSFENFEPQNLWTIAHENQENLCLLASRLI